MNNSSTYINSFFEAMKTVSSHTTANSNSPLTIEARIENVVDAGAGIYSVSYMTNVFEVRTNPSLTYEIGENVYVLVPAGDFSNDKFIIGTTKNSTTVFVNDDETLFYDISDNLITNTLLATSEHGLSSYKDTVSAPEDISKDGKSFGQLMRGYVDDYNYFRLDVKVRTALEKEQQIYGNYGIVLAIPVIIDNVEDSYEYFSIDITNMKGSPYQFLEWAPQSLIFSLNNTYDTSRQPQISLFCSGFPQDEEKALTITDLFFSDISFKCVNKMAEQDLNGYFLTLKASEGEYFVGTYRSQKTIEPTLRLNGKPTAIPNTAPIYWFKEDMSVKNDSDYYSRYGGMGWKCLNEKIDIIVDKDGSKTFSYNTSPRTLEVKKEDVAFATRYKCVIVYDENNLSSIITLRNLESNSFITLSCDSATNTYLTGSGGRAQLIVNSYVNLITDRSDYINQMSYSFLRYDLNNQPIIDDDTFFNCIQKNKMISLDIDKDGEKESVYQSIFTFPISAIDTLNKIYCIGKYNKEDRVIDVGTASISIMTSDRLKYNIIINNANQIYKYDADGDSPMIEAYDGPAASKVESIAPLTFEIYDEEGNEFGESQYSGCYYSWIVPKKCMVVVEKQEPTREDEDNYYYEGTGHLSQLNYSIARRYNKAAAMNGIKLVITYGKEIIQADVPLFFLKDGESGTNGTSYAAILTSGMNYTQSYPYGVRNDNKITQKITLVYNTYNNKWWYRNTEGMLCQLDDNLPKIFPKVYYNGSQLDSTNYTIEYEVFDPRITNPCITIGEQDSNNGIKIQPIKDQAYDLSINTCNIIQAKIVAKNASAMNSDEQILYAYYPIEIVVIDSVIPIDSLEGQPFPSIDGGFYDVLYASDGTNPSYDETELFYLSNVNTDLYTISWVAQHHLSQSVPTDEDNNPIPNAVKITPDNKYSDGNTMNYVRADMVINGNSTVMDRMAERANLEKERDELLKSKTDTENREKHLIAFGEKWFSQIGLLDSIKDFVNTRGAVVDDANSIISLINDNEKLLIDKTLISDMTILKTTLRTKIHTNSFEEIEKDDPDSYDSIDAIFVSDLNTRIDKYNTDLQTYSPLIESDDAKIFEKVLYDTTDGLSILSREAFFDTDFEFYQTLNADFLKYYENGKYDAFIKYFNNLYEKDLKTLFDKKDNILVISSVESKDIADKKKFYSEEISKKEKEIAEVNNAIGLDHIEMAYIRPIVITTNRYEMANFNAWDGNKIYVDDAKSYIMAPQIGAGTKEKDNSFTGIVMGGKTTNNQTRYGMFGYYYGEQTLMLSAENGSAIFGKAKSNSGQIIIDPTADSALLYSSKFFKSTAIDNNTGLPTTAAYQEVESIIQNRGNVNQNYVAKEGMLIDLTTPGIVFGSGNFKVTPEGYLVAKAGGSIGGWNIGIDSLYSQNFKAGSAGVELNATGYIAFGSDSGKIYSGRHNTLISTKDGFYLSGEGLSIGGKFKVNKDGVVEIGKGATTSTGRHWIISATDDDTYIKYGDRGSTSGNGSVYISTSEICLGNKFRVTSEGVVYVGDGAVKENNSKHWTISGKRRPGADSAEPMNAYIGYNRNCFGENENGYINRESVYIGTDGIALGRTFSVDAEGNLKAENADIRGHISGDTGLIGGWSIGPFSDRPGVDDSPAIYRSLTEGDKLMGTMVLKYDKIYGYNDANAGAAYQCWQLNANGLTFFSELHLYTNPAGAHGVMKLNGGTIEGGGVIKDCKLEGCDLSSSLSLKTISFKDKNGNTITCYCP